MITFPSLSVLVTDIPVRRSTRIKVPPLAHWRNERIVYELESRRQSGPALPKIKEIIRIDTPPHPSRATASAIHAPSRGQGRKRKVDLDSSSDDESDAGEVYATIKAFDDGGTGKDNGNRDGGMIADYRIAVAKSAMNPQPLLGRGVHFQKLFQDGGYVACGIMDVVVGGVKATKPTRHSYMTFAVMCGKVEVKVNRTAFVIGKGGVFVVPRGIALDLLAFSQLSFIYLSSPVNSSPFLSRPLFLRLVSWLP
jgi:centromere protein C